MGQVHLKRGKLFSVSHCWAEGVLKSLEELFIISDSLNSGPPGPYNQYKALQVRGAQQWDSGNCHWMMSNNFHTLILI